MLEIEPRNLRAKRVTKEISLVEDRIERILIIRDMRMQQQGKRLGIRRTIEDQYGASLILISR